MNPLVVVLVVVLIVLALGGSYGLRAGWSPYYGGGIGVVGVVVLLVLVLLLLGRF
jgi:hypothetical protein